MIVPSFNYHVPPRPAGISVDQCAHYVLMDVTDGMGHEFHISMDYDAAQEVTERLLEAAKKAYESDY